MLSSSLDIAVILPLQSFLLIAAAGGQQLLTSGAAWPGLPVINARFRNGIECGALPCATNQSNKKWLEKKMAMRDPERFWIVSVGFNAITVTTRGSRNQCHHRQVQTSFTARLALIVVMCCVSFTMSQPERERESTPWSSTSYAVCVPTEKREECSRRYYDHCHQN